MQSYSVHQVLVLLKSSIWFVKKLTLSAMRDIYFPLFSASIVLSLTLFSTNYPGGKPHWESVISEEFNFINLFEVGFNKFDN